MCIQIESLMLLSNIVNVVDTPIVTIVLLELFSCD